MRSLVLRSPAKLNLFLKVINKRPDGYHNLITLFERIDLMDEIRLSATAGGKIRIFCGHPQVPKGPQNLVFRVAALLQKRYEIGQGVDIHIQKCIPVAAGLAGGSSNAATTLLGLNKIWRLGLKSLELCQIGRMIGSDVPFFLRDTSWALGLERGDVIVPQDIRTKLWQILVVPRRKMLTPQVYRRLNLELTKTNDDVNILIRSLKENNIKRAKRLLTNDLETSIVRICPQLLYVKRRFETLLGDGVCFSGSGPSVYGVVESREEAEAAQAVLSKQYSRVFVVRTL